MYKLLIADDERLIREGLKTIIDWKAEGFYLAGTAANGNQCEQMIETEKPDLCIIDIRMPGKTGLEVIENCRKNKIRTRFIILSGYSEFEFARKAIRFGVRSYLLKPIEEDELIKDVRKIHKELKNDQAKTGNTLTAARDYLRECADLSHQNHFDSAPPSADWENYQILLMDTTLAKVNQLNNFFTKDDQGIVINYERPLIIILNKCYFREEGLKELNSLLAEMGKEYGLEIDGCISPVYNIAEDTAGHLLQLKEIWKERFFANRSGIISASDIPEFSSETETLFDEKQAQAKIEKLIEIGMESNLEKELCEISQTLINSHFSSDELKDKLGELALSALEGVISRQKLKGVSSEEHSRLVMGFQKCRRINELTQNIRNSLSEIIDKRDFQTNKRLVNRMMFLIENHYMENLKLKDLSKILFYNNAYLGKVFKAESGVSFNVYLDQTRIEKAKHFLEEGYKVYQVSEKVGYSYVDYFHAKFRKYVGKSPLEYRDECFDNRPGEDLG